MGIVTEASIGVVTVVVNCFSHADAGDYDSYSCGVGGDTTDDCVDEWWRR